MRANLVSKSYTGLALVFMLYSGSFAGTFKEKYLATASKDKDGNPVKTVRLPKEARSGDCRMAEGSALVFYPNGTGKFSSAVKTVKTSSGDIWHADFTVVQLPSGSFNLKWDSVRMWAIDPVRRVPIGWYVWKADFTFDPAAFDGIDGVIWKGDC